MLFAEVFAILGKIEKLEPVLVSSDADGVTPLQMTALTYLNGNPAANPSQLSVHLGVTPSATTQLTDRLVDLGYIMRLPSRADRRVITLALTPKGEEVFSNAFRKRTQKIQALLDPVPEKDLRDLLRIYTDILIILEKKGKQ